jgi:hypothetical protein
LQHLCQCRNYKVTVGINTGIDYDAPALIINTLFSTIFGRRLGTEDDGTTLRANPELGVDPDFDDSQQVNTLHLIQEI